MDQVQVLSVKASATTIKHGVISSSSRAIVEELLSIPEGANSIELPDVSVDGLSVYSLTLRRRMKGPYPKETICGEGVKRFIQDNSLKIGDIITLYKEPGVARLSNALLTKDCYILAFEKC